VILPWISRKIQLICTAGIAERTRSVNPAVFFFFFTAVLFFHSQTTIMHWIQSKERWLCAFQDPNGGLGPSLPEEFPLKETQFSLEKKGWSTNLFLFFSSCPLCRTPSQDKGRLHKSVTQEIPTLYFLSDKEPVTGDEFVAAGGFDRLWGNNKAISVCQKSQTKEREKKNTWGRYKSLVW